jgi:hypothetical protein
MVEYVGGCEEQHAAEYPRNCVAEYVEQHAREWVGKCAVEKKTN